MKDELGDANRPQHFSIEQAPEEESELVKRNAYLCKYGITPIWFEKERFDYVENILRHARNELRYQGIELEMKKNLAIKESLLQRQNHRLLKKLIMRFKAWLVKSHKFNFSKS